MSEETKIEWCDYTFNPWEGCAKVSPGCANCYAEARNARWNGGTAPNWGRGAPRRRTSVANWRKPLRWDREAGNGEFRECSLCGWRGNPYTQNFGCCGNPECLAMPSELDDARPRVFCASLADWLDEEVPLEWLADLLLLIDQTRALDWLLLTKRPEKWHDAMTTITDTWVPRSGDRAADIADNWKRGEPLPNVWIGTSVEDQRRADERIPDLLAIPAHTRFLSAEPLLGPVTLSAFMGRAVSLADKIETYNFGIDWVIAGGESGSRARPCHVEWLWDLQLQCAAAGVAFFGKQLGSVGVVENANALEWPVGTRWGPLPAGLGDLAAGARVRTGDSKGGEWDEWPEVLRVREWPDVIPF